jgi:hypothetical protein
MVERRQLGHRGRALSGEKLTGLWDEKTRVPHLRAIRGPRELPLNIVVALLLSCWSLTDLPDFKLVSIVVLP